MSDNMFSHYDEIVQAINDIGIVGNAKKREHAIKVLSEFVVDFAAIKQTALPSQKYVEALEERVYAAEERADKNVAKRKEAEFRENRANQKLERSDEKLYLLNKVFEQVQTEVLAEYSPEVRKMLQEREERKRGEWSR